MRKTFKFQGNKEFWKQKLTSVKVDDAQEEEHSYPLKYALEVIGSTQESILEAGCGNGRTLRYFHQKGYNIKGFDFIGDTVQILKRCDPKLKIQVSDIKNLKYKSSSFDCILAFGLYHNLEEDDLATAIKETAKIMKNDERPCASFRADKFQISHKRFHGRL